MFVRLLSTAALAGGLIGTPVQSDPTAAVTTLHYKIGIVAQSTLDLSAMGAGEQKNTAGFSGYFTMTLKDTTGGKALTMVLDSMAVDSATQGQAILQAAADSSKGSTWKGLLTEKGKIDNLVFVQGGPGAQQFEAVLAGFFPRGAAHTKKKGDVWTDTLSYTSTSDAGSTSIKMETTFTAAGEGMYNNTKALTINTTSVTSSVGSQSGPGGDMQLEGAGTGVGTYYVTKEGTYLGGTNTLDSDIVITTSQAPMPIPLKAHTVITIGSF
ncbi:MAG: hypothetical protein R2910_09640 [Gemmatimonadales bacterium]